jgi:putative ABC transport system permease protein
MFLFAFGLSLLVLGLMLFLRRYLPTRLVFTIGAGLMLAYWLLPPDVTSRVLPDVGDGGPEMLVVSGIFMVLYATLILMWNAELLVGVVGLLGRSFARWLPAVKMAVAYPLSAKGRTGMTIAMFSIVVFALVTISTVSVNFRDLFLSDDAAAGWDVRVVTSPSNPIDDLPASLSGSQVDLNQIEAIGRVESVPGAGAPVRNPGATWEQYQVNGMDDSYIDNAVVGLQTRAEGYESDGAVWDALRAGEPVALIDALAFEADEFGGGGERYMAPTEIDIGEDTFQPFEIEIQNPAGTATETVTVIGVIDPSASTLNGIYLGQDVYADVYTDSAVSTQFFLRLNDMSVADAEAYADEIQGTLRTSGVQADSIIAEIEEGQEQQSSFFTLIEGFMGLGLFVGLAALGVISFRSVVERRQQIGMLRAIGYQRSMVAASFMIESLVTATLGVLSGAGLAIALSYNLITSGMMGDEEFDGFIVPGGTIALVILGSLAAAALMTWIPARSASTVPIADALRYE